MAKNLIDTGQKFPEFSLVNQDGKPVRLEDFSGKWWVLYVYPKDDTPGCTLEGRGFTAAKPEFDRLGATVVGLSADDAASHKNFCNKYSFSITLLADTKGELLSALGVGQSDYKGVKYWNRVTFVIDPKGVVRKVYPSVKPDGHEKEVLKDLQSLIQS